MAERRMFARSIISTDDFLDLPATSKVLYFYLMAEADDDGFVDRPKGIMRLIGSTVGDIQPLIDKGYVIAFDSGIVVVRHWKLHNYIQKDRYHPSLHPEKKLVEQDSTGAYQLACIQDVSNADTGCIQPVSLGKDRLGKVSIDKCSVEAAAEATPGSEAVDDTELVKYWEQQTGTSIMPAAIERLKEYVEDFGKPFVAHGIKEMAANGANNPRYLQAILERWKSTGLEEPWKEEYRGGRKISNSKMQRKRKENGGADPNDWSLDRWNAGIGATT